MRARVHSLAPVLIVAALPVFAACDSLLSFFVGLETVTVRLVNNGDFPVEVRVAISDEDDIPEAILEEDDDLEFTIAAGQATSFSRNCDDLRAVMITHAELRVVGGIGPEADSGVLREGDDFSCGDIIVFRFTHSDLIVDFDVSTSVQ